MRLRVLGVVALLVATAGCSALVGGGEPTATLTPAPVPTAEPTPSDPRVGVAPGVSRSTVTHPDFLAHRHQQVTDGLQYELSIRYHQNRSFNDVEAAVDRRQRIVVENATVYRRDASSMERRINGNVHFLTGYGEYADGDAKYLSWIGPSGENRTFRRHEDASARPNYAGVPAGAIQRYLDLESATISRHAVPGSDAQYYLVRGTRSSLLTVDNVSSYSARAIVREDGFVRRLTVTFDGMDHETTVSTRYSFAYRKVGNATVEPPAWIDEARATFEDGSGNTSANETAIPGDGTDPTVAGDETATSLDDGTATPTDAG